MPTRLRRSTAAMAASMLALSASTFAAPTSLAITDVAVVDVAHSRTDTRRTVTIEDDRIVAIVPSKEARIPAGAQRIDGRGRWLIPGLVDMHVHLFNLSSRRAPNDWTFPLFVANGVTAVRNMATDAASMEIVRRWRRETDAGERIAPRILGAGIVVYGATPADAARDVIAAADAGADFVKIYSEVPAAQWHAIMAAARTRALPVAGHVPAQIRLVDAAVARQRSDEHLTQAVEACSSIGERVLDARRGASAAAIDALLQAQDAALLNTFDRATCRRAARALAPTALTQVPTLVLADVESRPAPPPDADPRWGLLREDERARWTRILASDTSRGDALAQRRRRVALDIVAVFHDAGITPMPGTDTPMPSVWPGWSLHEELALLVEAGLTPREALRAATLAPAEFFGVEATSGSIAAGKRADLVLLDADPAQDIRNTRRIDAVVVGGRLLQRGDLDALTSGSR